MTLKELICYKVNFININQILKQECSTQGKNLFIFDDILIAEAFNKLKLNSFTIKEFIKILAEENISLGDITTSKWS